MRFLLAILVLLLETAALASPTGKVGYSGKQVKTCSKCHSGGTAP